LLLHRARQLPADPASLRSTVDDEKVNESFRVRFIVLIYRADAGPYRR
jgi:hypothetical protein